MAKGRKLTRRNLSLKKLIATVREVAAEKPDFKYQNKDEEGFMRDCSYFPDKDNAEGCIMGCSLSRMNIRVDLHMEGDAIDSLLMRAGFRDETSMQWCKKVQMAQDDGMTWAEAVASADADQALVRKGTL